MDDLRITGTGWGDFAEEPSQVAYAENSREDNDARGTYKEPQTAASSKSRNGDTDSWQQPPKPGSHQSSFRPTEAWEQQPRQHVEFAETPKGFEPQPPPSGPRQMPWDKKAPAPATIQTKEKAAKRSRESQYKSEDLGIDINLFPSCVSLPPGDFRRDEPRHEESKRRESKVSVSSHNEPSINKPKPRSEQRDNGARPEPARMAPVEPPSRPMSGNVDSKKRINDLVRSIGMRKASPQEEISNDFNRPLRIREIPEDGPGYVKTRSVERVPFQKALQREDPADREYSRGRIDHTSVRVDDWGNDDSDGETHHIGPLVDHHAEYYWKQTGEYLDDFSESNPVMDQTAQRHSEAVKAVTAQMQDARFSNVQADPWQPTESQSHYNYNEAVGNGNVEHGSNTNYGNNAGYEDNTEYGNNSGRGDATHEESAAYGNAYKASADYVYGATYYDPVPTNSAAYYDPVPTNSATYYDAVSTCSATYENSVRNNENSARTYGNPTHNDNKSTHNDDKPTQMNENPIKTKEDSPVLAAPPVRRRSLDTYSPCLLSDAQELRAPSNYKPNDVALDEGQSWVTCPFCHNGFGYPPLMLPTPPYSGLVANTAFTPKT